MPLNFRPHNCHHTVRSFHPAVCCLSAFALVWLSSILTPANAPANETDLTKAAQGKGVFEALSKGDTLEDWKHNGNWQIQAGVISRQGKGGSLVYMGKKVPDDFELKFEWKVGKGSNSGIYYRPTQYEYQILDNDVHADGKNPRTSAASLYFCVPPSRDNTKPVGQWNTGRIICKGTIVQHWLNGEKVIHLDYQDPKWASNVEMLKQRGGNLDARGAHLSLQDHGDPVWYRKLQLKELHPEDKIDLTEVQPAKIKPEVLEAEKKKLAGIIQRRTQAKQRQQQKKK
ncbi:MAG: glycosyl hydrolase [Rhodopirellula sp.]|nr:glycosyl hydrolase [Rhodopirellula sp.]